MYDSNLKDYEYPDNSSCPDYWDDISYFFNTGCHPAATATFNVTILPSYQPQVFERELVISATDAWALYGEVIELTAYTPNSIYDYFTISGYEIPAHHPEAEGADTYDTSDTMITYQPYAFGYYPFVYTVTDQLGVTSLPETFHIYVVNLEQEWRIHKWKDVFIYPTEVNDEFFIDVTYSAECTDQYNDPSAGQYCFGLDEGVDVEHDFTIMGMYVSNELQIKNCSGITGTAEGDYGIDWTTACEDYTKFVCNIYTDTWNHPDGAFYNSCGLCANNCKILYDSDEWSAAIDWHCAPNKLSNCSAGIDRTDLSTFYSKFYNLLPSGEVSELGLEDKILITYNVNSDRFRIRVYDMTFYGIVRVMVNLIRLDTSSGDTSEWYQTFDLYVNVTENLYLQPSS